MIMLYGFLKSVAFDNNRSMFKWYTYALKQKIQASHFLQNISFISPVWRSLNKHNS